MLELTTNSPEPEDEEVLLVEEVVLEDAQEVAAVQATRGGANIDVARHLHQEDFSVLESGFMYAIVPQI